MLPIDVAILKVEYLYQLAPLPGVLSLPLPPSLSLSLPLALLFPPLLLSLHSLCVHILLPVILIYDNSRKICYMYRYNKNF